MKKFTDFAEERVVLDGPKIIPTNTAPEFTAAETQDMSMAVLDIEKVARLTGGFLVDGVLFDSDVNAEIRYMQLQGKFAADPTYSVPWKAANNVWVTMDLALFQTVIAAFEANLTGVYTWLAAEQAKL